MVAQPFDDPIVGYAGRVDCFVTHPGSGTREAIEGKVHLAIAQVAHGCFMLAASPVPSRKPGELFCSHSSELIVDVKIDKPYTLEIHEGTHYISLHKPRNGHVLEEASFIFPDDMEFWSFIGEFSEARIKAEIYANEEEERVKKARACLLRAFPPSFNFDKYGVGG